MSRPASPPRHAERLVRAVIRDERWRDVTLGDLGEEHNARAAASGRITAALWYWGQTIVLATDAARDAIAGLVPAGASIMLKEITFAFRSFLRQPLVAAVIVATLALGLGSNAATFGMIDSLLLRPFTFPGVDRLVVFSENSAEDPYPQESVSPANYLDFASNKPRTVSRLTVTSWWDVNIAGGDQPEAVQGTRVSPDFFAMLSASPAMGRDFAPADAIWGNHRVAILGEGLWHRRFGADPNIVGKQVRLDGESYDVIGVAPAKFDFPNGTQIWAPRAFNAEEAANRESHYLTVIAELAPGATLDDVQAEMTTRYAQIKRDHPAATRDLDLIVRTFTEALVDFGLPRILGLWQAAAILVLLIGCVNVANLLLARGAERQREIAVRLAIGAGRWQLVRQLLLEAVVIAVLSVPAALAVAWIAFGLLKSAMPATLIRFVPGWTVMGIDSRVALFTFVAALVTAVIFGLLPALQVSRPQLTSALRDGGRSATAGAARSRLRRVLVVAQVALALPLLVLSGLAAASSHRLANGPQGYDPTPLLRMRMRLPAAVYPDAASRQQFIDRLLLEARAAPGVTSVATTNLAPTSSSGSRTDFILEGATSDDGRWPLVNYRAISADYFSTMSIPMLRGRTISDSDRSGRERVAVVSESLAKRFYPDTDAIGKRVKLDEDAEEWTTIVGVAGDIIDDWFANRRAPTVYVPALQASTSNVYLMARGNGDPESLLPGLRAAIARVDPSQPAYDIATMPTALRERTTGIRFIGGLMAAFGLLAMALATFGIYGVMSHYVAQRRAEIGVRMALGATRGHVLRLTIGQGTKLAAIGIAIGLAIGIALARLMESALLGVITAEPSLFALITLALAFIAFLATLVPASQAARVDPVGALRD
ncbi:MAG TPA: ABC transporter permease [Vicinamibacterales bacterium]|nr:ABC transporter permease [Vicinamibacterales bacterium]